MIKSDRVKGYLSLGWLQLARGFIEFQAFFPAISAAGDLPNNLWIKLLREEQSGNERVLGNICSKIAGIYSSLNIPKKQNIYQSKSEQHNRRSQAYLALT